MIAALLLAATVAAPAPKSEWFVPLSVGYEHGATFGLGAGYRFGNGVTLSLQGVAHHVNGEEYTRMVDPDDFFLRWQPQPVTVTVPGETKYGGMLTVTLPIKR